MNIAENIRSFTDRLPETVDLIAVSKTKPNEDILTAYEAGHRAFGENKVQELAGKAEALPKDIQWHLIGHLQTNKVKYVAPFVHLIHAVDSLKLLKEINKRAAQNDRVIDCLLQLRIAKEDTKFGLTREDLTALLDSPEFAAMENVRITGLMGMATNTPDSDQVREEFNGLSELFAQLQSTHFSGADHFVHRSMGMSGDWELAVAEGSTMVRVGSAIFGARSYPPAG